MYCLFEQSGTFKNEFRKLGIDAEDYDILNDFGETDHISDLFAEIDNAYDGKPSLFDSVGADDLVIAFFPCTRFECIIPLAFRGEQLQQKHWNDLQKLDYSMKLHEELHQLYMHLCKLFTISLRGGWRMIVENPYTQPHYLTQFFPIKPTIVDKDRTKMGDYYKKPTQYWFLNCTPEQNVIWESLESVGTYTIDRNAKILPGVDRKVQRSLIHPQYARRFIKTFIMNGDYNNDSETSNMG